MSLREREIARESERVCERALECVRERDRGACKTEIRNTKLEIRSREKREG